MMPFDESYYKRLSDLALLTVKEVKQELAPVPSQLMVDGLRVYKRFRKRKYGGTEELTVCVVFNEMSKHYQFIGTPGILFFDNWVPIMKACEILVGKCWEVMDAKSLLRLKFEKTVPFTDLNDMIASCSSTLF